MMRFGVIHHTWMHHPKVIMEDVQTHKDRTLHSHKLRTATKTYTATEIFPEKRRISTFEGPSRDNWLDAGTRVTPQTAHLSPAHTHTPCQFVLSNNACGMLAKICPVSLSSKTQPFHQSQQQPLRKALARNQTLDELRWRWGCGRCCGFSCGWWRLSAVFEGSE